MVVTAMQSNMNVISYHLCRLCHVLNIHVIVVYGEN